MNDLKDKRIEQFVQVWYHVWAIAESLQQQQQKTCGIWDRYLGKNTWNHNDKTQIWTSWEMNLMISVQRYDSKYGSHNGVKYITPVYIYNFTLCNIISLLLH